MKPLSRFETVVALLETYNDARETLQAGNDRAGAPDSRELYMPNLWHEGSYAELERILRLMRSRGKQLTPIPLPDGGKVNVHTAYWQVCEWWLRCTRRTTMVPVRHKGKHGKSVTVLERRVEVRRHPDAREVKAMAGARWIAEHMQGSPQLPLAFLENMTGYVPAKERRAA